MGIEDIQTRFWDLVCSYSLGLWSVFAVAITLLLLSLVTFFFIPPGTSGHFIIQIDLVLFGSVSMAILLLQWRCAKRSSDIR